VSCGDVDGVSVRGCDAEDVHEETRRGEVNAERGDDVKFRVFRGATTSEIDTGEEAAGLVTVAEVAEFSVCVGSNRDILRERIGVGRGLCTRRRRLASLEVMKRGSDLDGVRRGGAEDLEFSLCGTTARNRIRSVDSSVEFIVSIVVDAGPLSFRISPHNIAIGSGVSHRGGTIICGERLCCPSCRCEACCACVDDTCSDSWECC
jgi:hypothetical protein